MHPLYLPLAVLGGVVIANLGVSVLFGWVLVLGWWFWLAIALPEDGEL